MRKYIFYFLLIISSIAKGQLYNAGTTMGGNQIKLVVNNTLVRFQSLIIDSTKIQDNAFNFQRANLGYITSTFSNTSFLTDATSLNITGGTTNTDVSNATISIFINGIYNQQIKYTASDVGKITNKIVTLPSGIKTVKLMMGLMGINQSGTSFSTAILGQFLNSVSGTCTTLITIPPVILPNRVLVLGNSITVGTGTTIPEMQGFIPMIRQDMRFDKQISSYGAAGNWLSIMCANPSNLNKLVADFQRYYDGASQKQLYIELGTNDYGFSKESATVFAGYYASLLDALHTAIPDLIIFAQTMFLRTNETTPNVTSNVLEDYRSAIIGTVSTRSSFVNLIDGKSILKSTTFMPLDGLHPGPTGNAVIKEYLTRLFMNIEPIPNIAAPPIYVKTTGDATGVITLINNSGSINIGGKSNVTILFKVRKKTINQTDVIFGQQGVTNLKVSLASNNFFNFTSVTNSAGPDQQIADLNWHHYAVVITEQGTTVKIYQDGYLLKTSAFTGIPVPSPTTTKIGVTASGTQYGQIDLGPFAILNYAATQDQIIYHMVNDTLDTTLNAAAIYNFNNNLIDQTGNGNNGTPGPGVTYSNTP